MVGTAGVKGEGTEKVDLLDRDSPPATKLLHLLVFRLRRLFFRQRRKRCLQPSRAGGDLNILPEKTPPPPY